MYKILKDLI